MPYSVLHKDAVLSRLLLGTLWQTVRQYLSALQESGIPVPHHICVNRDGLPEGQDPEGFIETEDYVELDGKQPRA